MIWTARRSDFPIPLLGWKCIDEFCDIVARFPGRISEGIRSNQNALLLAGQRERIAIPRCVTSIVEVRSTVESWFIEQNPSGCIGFVGICDLHG